MSDGVGLSLSNGEWRMATPRLPGHLGERAGGNDYAAVAMAQKRFESKMKNDAKLRNETRELERDMLYVKM